MRDRHGFDGHRALLATWERDLRATLASGLPPETVVAVAAMSAAAVGTSALATAATAAIQGGTTMTTSTAATVGASASASMSTKIAAGVIAASLAAGAGTAVTGNLPSGMQPLVADAAAHIGLELPRPEARADLEAGVSAGLGVGEIVRVGTAGRVSATLDASTGLRLTGVEEAAGFSASVVASTGESIFVEFESATETAGVLLTEADGEIVVSVTGSAEAGAEADTGAEAVSGAETSVTGDDETVTVESDIDAGVRIGVGG